MCIWAVQLRNDSNPKSVATVCGVASVGDFAIADGPRGDQPEPPWVCRMLFGLSYAAITVSSRLS